MKYLLLSVLLLLGELSASAQHIFAREFPFYNQLSSNEIFSIHQDREGYFWIGTTNGLARYDGHYLHTFRSDYKNPNLLLNNGITTINDNHRYVLIGTWSGLNLFDKQTCRITPAPDAQLQGKTIHTLATGKDETIWVSAGNRVYRCDPSARVLKEFDFGEPQSDYIISDIYTDRDSQLWLIGTRGIFRYEPETDSFFRYPPLGKGHTAYLMRQDKFNNYWIGTWGEGLWQFFPNVRKGGHYKKYEMTGAKHSESESVVFAVEQDDTFGYLWTLSYAGLSAFRYTNEGILERVDIHDLVDTHMMYTRICKDREGNLWLSSYDMAYTIFFDNSNIENYPINQLKEQMGWDTNILNLCQSRDSTMWFRQDRYGLCMYDLSTKAFAPCGVGEVSVIIPSVHKPGIWASSNHAQRVMRLTRSGMKVKVEETINVGGVGGLLEDKDGNLWISTWANLQVKRPDNEAPVVSGRSIPMMEALTSDADGGVWGISVDNRICSLNCAGGQIVCEPKDTIPMLAPKERVSSICIDRKGCLWLSTTLGRILRTDAEMKNFENVLPGKMTDDSTILGLVSEKDKVWLITNKRVLQYNIDSQTFKSISAENENIIVDAFKERAFSLDGWGGLYVGGHRGFIHIRPGGALPDHKVCPPLQVTDVRIDDKSLFFGRAEASDKHTIDRITLDPDARNIEIIFSALSYSPNARYRIAYRLDGVDKDWVYPDHGRNSAFYNHLPQGTYKFRLKLEYKPGTWSESKVLLTLMKTPAYYETWFAYLLYTILVALCFGSVLWLYLRRLRLKGEVKLREELTRTKLTYFTNVSHELLTPLTVISCISEYLVQKSPAAQQQSAMLKANVDKLKRLIQQVLDFRKMDVGKLKLSVSEGTISDFVSGICRINFLPLARKKNLTLEVSIQEEDELCHLDFDKLDKILHNLLSNAIKYTPENKRITVDARILNEAGRRMLILKVEDEGIGISPHEIEHIFTRFYSNKKGRGVESNGIGLSLTKDLVNLHHGHISVESEPGRGTCFTVKIPVDKDSYSADELAEDATVLPTDAEEVVDADDTPSADDAGDKPTLLLIDDNAELLSVMKEMFKQRYTVLKAADGAQAWEKLGNHEVDVILCDVMLPDVNGWELCTRIKRDVRFSHIPLIIITAKSGTDSRVASYEAGADGYIAKPFEMKILYARVDNLIKASKVRQAAFRKEENISLEGLAYPSADKEFLQTIIKSIEQHLDESEFDLEQLSAEMNMSKSTLYRKIKSMSGMTPLDFMRNVKMKRACMMLLSRKQNISEIAYAIGFSSPKYFTKCFKEEFGLTPSEYVQKHNQ